MMNTYLRFFLTCVIASLLPTAHHLLAAGSTVLWYNGDQLANLDVPWKGVTGNVVADNIGERTVYDDFIVTDPSGWVIDRVWTNNLIFGTIEGRVTEAFWSIRSGVSLGDGGVEIASGIDPATITSTGRGHPYFERFHYSEYSVEVSNLNLHLTPGRYWLSVAPLMGFDRAGIYDSLISGTEKDGAFGSPLGTNGNSFLNHPEFDNSGNDRHFVRPVPDDHPPVDYSMGVAGIALSSVPEPSSYLASALLMTIYASQRKRQTSA